MEKKLWEQGIRRWQDFIQTREIQGIGSKRKAHYDRLLLEASRHLRNGNLAYFQDRLPSAEHWRLFDHCKRGCLFIDIEAHHSRERPLVIGVYNGEEMLSMISHQCDPKLLRDLLHQASMVVSFNGLAFDLPFLERWAPGCVPQTFHWDLKTSALRLGYSGGLKEVEKALGITRSLAHPIKSGESVQLWKKYLATGDDDFFDLLVQYNEEDCVNLQRIAERFYSEQKKVLGF